MIPDLEDDAEEDIQQQGAACGAGVQGNRTRNHSRRRLCTAPQSPKHRSFGT